MHQTINHKVKLNRLDNSFGRSSHLFELKTKLLLNKSKMEIHTPPNKTSQTQ